jgi:molybdopterin converting factor small subunit
MTSERPTDPAEPCTCSVRVFGSLRPALEERGRPYEFTVDVPPEGIIARELAEELELDVPRVEGVFVNHLVHGLGIRIMPGDEIGFVPNDIPGPHRYYLGLYTAGKDESA